MTEDYINSFEDKYKNTFEYIELKNLRDNILIEEFLICHKW